MHSASKPQRHSLVIMYVQGCQMVSFQTKNPNSGEIFVRALDWKQLIYFTAIWNILQTFEILYL
jgi:hypothetical protein